MKKELREKMAKYASAAAAISGVAGVNAQIVYTDVNPDVTVNDDPNANGFTVIGLDIDNDSNIDFIVAAKDTTITANSLDLRYTLAAPYGSSNAIANDAAGSYTSAMAFNNGDAIDNSLNWLSGASATQTMAWSTQYFSSGGTNLYANFNGVTDKYLGLRFNTGGSTYYGWARFDFVAGEADHFTLKDYAYNSTADGAINAGDMGTAGLADADLDALVHFINQTNNTVLVKVNGELTNGVVNVVSTSGQIVQTGKVENGTFVVNMNGLTAGVYMINVTFEEGSMTKKMYVH